MLSSFRLYNSHSFDDTHSKPNRKGSFEVYEDTNTMTTSSGVLILLATVCTMGGAQDLTRQEKETGSAVVEAVIDMIHYACVLPQDYFLLRRLAYVESRDGTDPHTFPPDFYGGIWQVTQSMYNTTKTAYLEPLKNIIASTLLIDWDKTQWTDLLKPLYSGLAAALYVAFTVHDGTFPSTIPDQETYWRDKYRNESMDSQNYTALASVLEMGCQGQADLDLVFILDTSSSISGEDFAQAKQFVLKVSGIFDIDSGHVRVAIITYSTEAQVKVRLGEAGSKVNLTSLINNLTYESGGTETAAALKLAETIFISQARHGAVKVAVLITDGQSQDTRDAVDAARSLRSGSNVLLLVVGVGNQIDNNELYQITSTPSCMHVFKVSSFDQIEEVRETIQHLTCRAPLILPVNSTASCTLGNCPPYAIPATNAGGVVKAHSMCTLPIRVYAAYGVAYPVPSQSDQVIDVSGAVTTVHFSSPPAGQPLFYIRLNQTEADSNSHCLVTLTVLPYDVQVQCIENNKPRNCTARDLQLFAPDLCL